MSKFFDLYKQLSGLRCTSCGGLGTQDDADIGDTSFNEWECPDCNGTGIQSGTTVELVVGVIDG